MINDDIEISYVWLITKQGRNIEKGFIEYSNNVEQYPPLVGAGVLNKSFIKLKIDSRFICDEEVKAIYNGFKNGTNKYKELKSLIINKLYQRLKTIPPGFSIKTGWYEDEDSGGGEGLYKDKFLKWFYDYTKNKTDDIPDSIKIKYEVFDIDKYVTEMSILFNVNDIGDYEDGSSMLEDFIKRHFWSHVEIKVSGEEREAYIDFIMDKLERL